MPSDSVSSELPTVSPTELNNSSLPFVPSISFNNVHHFLTVKLSPENYLIWRSQFLPLLRTTGLLGMVDGSTPRPSPFLDSNSSTPTANPAYITWQQEDQTVLSWILSSLTEPVHSQVVGLRSAAEVWNALSSAYASSSQARIMQLRLQLRNIKKGSDSMTEYLLKIKRISDALSLASQPISDQDLVLNILGGLGTEYQAFVSSISTRESPVRLADLHGLLYSEEIRLASALQDITNVSANVASSSVTASSTANPRPFWSNSSNPSRHSDLNYCRNQGGRFGGRHSGVLICQLCERPGHHARNCSQNPDFGSHHITSDLGSISSPSEYLGNETDRLKDRSAFFIKNIGVSLRTPSIILFIYRAIKKRRLHKFFKQNGGLLLQQQIASYKGVNDLPKIFTIKELKRATKNFDENQILGEGGSGKVYRGILPGEKIVAIKKSKIADQTQIIRFINEVDILSQINHKHVVKLLGCCLETEVPLLVYEFVSNGTLHQLIHNMKKASATFPWEDRLRIAAETADALAYLHSSHSVPIFHRDVKSSNILLDDKYSAKVSDFGASRLVPLDQTQTTTDLQGTYGYIDPECWSTGHLTDKSDVYSFGVVLAELLTGEKPIFLDESEERIVLARVLTSSVKNGNLFHILDDRIKHDDGNSQQFLIVAEIARNCLEDRREDRPTMKEVAKELDSLKMIYEQPTSQHILEEIDISLGGQSTSSFDPTLEMDNWK